MRIPDRLDRGADDARDVAGRVDDGGEGATGERAEVAVAVPVPMLGCRKEVRIRAPPVEERQLVIARERRLGDGAAEELRPAEDE